MICRLFKRPTLKKGYVEVAVMSLGCVDVRFRTGGDETDVWRVWNAPPNMEPFWKYSVPCSTRPV